MLRFISILLLLLTFGVKAEPYKPVKIKGKFTVIPYDSLYYTNPPSAKTSYMVDNRTIDVYTDSDANPVIVIIESVFPNYTYVDSVLVSENWGLIRTAHARLDKDGEQSEYKVTTPDSFRHLDSGGKSLWSPLYSSSSGLSLDTLAGTKLDSKGNWTEVHNYAGNALMEKKARVKRSIHYTLTPKETAMVNESAAQRISVVERNTTQNESSWLKSALFLIGFILLAVAPIFISWINDHLKPLMMLFGVFGSLICLTLICKRLDNLHGPIICVVVVLMYLALMCWYLRTISIHLMACKSLGNKEIKFPLTCVKILLVLFGYFISSALGNMLVFSILGAICFALPFLLIRKDGERCNNCHSVGSVYTEDVIECGTRTKKDSCYISGYEHTLNTVYQQVKELRRCRVCGYAYYTSPMDGEILYTYKTYENTPSSRSSSTSSKESSSTDYFKYRPNFFDCKYYGSGGCTLGTNHSCDAQENQSNQAYCHHFSPSYDFLRRIRK